MSNDKKGTNTRFAITTLNLLTIIFITLKLCDVIDWSWWWVLAPTWAPWAALAAFAVVACFIVGACELLSQYLERKQTY